MKLGDKTVPNQLDPPGRLYNVFPLSVATGSSTPLNGRRSDQDIVLLKIHTTAVAIAIAMVLLQLDPFLNELTSMFERSTEKGSVWVTLKRSSLKSKVQRNKMTTAGQPIEYRCLIRATNGKKTISTSVGAKDHLRFQASYSTILKAHMTALKKRERKDKKKAAEAEKGLKKKPRKV
ncbi:Signal recognition particle 14 kDa protein, partial [Cucurbita argyrosperma subsp. sororia]